MPEKIDKKIKPEIVAAIMAALAVCGFSPEHGYRVTGVRKKGNLWKEAGLQEAITRRRHRSE